MRRNQCATDSSGRAAPLTGLGLRYVREASLVTRGSLCGAAGLSAWVCQVLQAACLLHKYRREYVETVIGMYFLCYQ